MYYSTMKSPIGLLTLVASDNALIALYVNDEQMPKKTGAVETQDNSILTKTKHQLKEYFEGKRKTFDLPLEPQGTEFQKKAWSALSVIPFGQFWSYGKQADYLKNPKGQRAVGGANGKNPIPVIIPCHRVIGSTGKLTGFSGGMEMKIFLLKLEGHQVDADGLKIINQL